MHVTTTDFRAALGAFATGVCVAATRDATGAPAGVTVNSFASVSLEPPLVLFCLGRGGTALASFSAAPSWAIHVLADNQRDLARRFALSRRHAPGVDPWDGLAWEEDDTRLPVIPGCLARLTCLAERVVDGGDHAILLGRVARLSWEKAGRPLLYFRGRYEAVAEAHPA